MCAITNVMTLCHRINYNSSLRKTRKSRLRYLIVLECVRVVIGRSFVDTCTGEGKSILLHIFGC